MTIKMIGVVGAGAMGTGIAHIAAETGFQVKVYDQSEKATEKSLAAIHKFSSSAVEKGQQSLTDRELMLSRLHYISAIEDLTHCDLIIEAIVEKLEVKKSLFKQLDAILPDRSIIASNTSSISITSLAAATTRPDRVAGMHFFNPVQRMKLVEVVRGFNSSDETIRVLKEVAIKMGKTAIEVKRDTPGFVVNRLLMPQLREAIKILEEGVASVEDIDTALRLGLNHPMGPFALQDLSGIDVLLYVLDYFRSEMGDAYAPPLLLRQMVQAGNWGRKTGKGWYDYSPKSGN